ncbi:MAG: hypothetical protein ACI81W_001938, partial [Saprospiraceae bacterium]
KNEIQKDTDDYYEFREFRVPDNLTAQNVPLRTRSVQAGRIHFFSGLTWREWNVARYV